MAFNWDDYQEVKAAPAPAQATAEAPQAAAPQPAAFDWNAHPEVQQEPGMLEAGLRGGAQGLSYGLSDEISGGGEALIDKVLGNSPEKSFGELYDQHTGESREANKAAQQAHPYIYGGANLAGGLASGVATGGLAPELGVAGRVGMGAAQGAVSGVGYGNASDLKSGAQDALEGAAVGGLVSGAVEGVSSAMSPGGLKSTAESLAENATGATGKQLHNFEDGAGRQLLDRGIVGFGDTPETIAQKAAGEMASAGKDITGSLGALDAGGAQLSKQELMASLQNKIDALSGRPSQTDTVRQLQKSLEDIKAGPDTYSLTAAEAEKRGFQDKVNWQNPDSNPGNAAASDTFKTAVEDKAQALDPNAAAQFAEGKSTWGLFAPIQEAAERRAATLAASPKGGLLDMATVAGGVASGHPVLAAAAPVARRVLAPRLASMGAVGADKLADIIKATPEALGPWAQQLSKAAARGSASLGATNYVLMQTNEAYRIHMRKLFDGNQ